MMDFLLLGFWLDPDPLLPAGVFRADLFSAHYLYLN